LKCACRIALLGWVTFCCVGVGSLAEPAPASAPVDKVAAAANDFGFRLLQTLLNASKDGNLVISPLSVSLALAITYKGAGGGTRMAMARTLDVSAFSDADVNAGNRELLETLRKADPAVQLEIANALWLQAGFSFEPDFIKLSHDFYQAEAETLNFEDDPGRRRSDDQCVDGSKYPRQDPFDSQSTWTKRGAGAYGRRLFQGQVDRAFRQEQNKPASFFLSRRRLSNDADDDPNYASTKDPRTIPLSAPPSARVKGGSGKLFTQSANQK
jgi:hypothetical protein